ncbi:thioredoxin-like protein [Sporormia fimetaria CBS 119925]|uniref:Thioredoxin-like protein n=1 Tax=Sporormia fimetaria CBS 119925 TaxID=1340428 RepID=A0A6A6VNF1_9PLEO|nr:thioredoxin-like protein [Sporormia fimetaria CBS 119925]
MGSLGKVRIGSRAPDFHCDAVTKGVIEGVSLADYIGGKGQRWLVILFIPAAFSFVCPTEVLAFQNCLEEFSNRKTQVVFVSVDTKHSLWHWQNVPRQYGGLGPIDIPLLSDVSHKMCRDYGVLIEDEGVCLRGMFILDGKGIVQHVTLNNVTVGRSVLEALRLLEAFQAVDRHGVLCPIDWKPPAESAAASNTISNALTESHNEHFANIQREFGDTLVTDLDAKYENISRHESNAAQSVEQNGTSRQGSHDYSTRSGTASSTRDDGNDAKRATENSSPKSLHVNGSVFVLPNSDEPRTNSAPPSTCGTPVSTPLVTRPPPLKLASFSSRRSRGSDHLLDRKASISRPQCHTTPSHPPLHPKRITTILPNTYESRRGSHVVLEFADPTSSPQSSPPAQNIASMATYTSTARLPHVSPTPSSRSATSRHRPSHRLATATYNPSPATSPDAGTEKEGPPSGSTRLQMNFDAIKKMSGMGSGLASPRYKFGRKSPLPRKGRISEGDERESGYFDSVGSEGEVGH